MRACLDIKGLKIPRYSVVVVVEVAVVVDVVVVPRQIEKL